METMAEDGPVIPVASAVDTHVHVMPEPLLSAIRDALTAQLGWTFNHPLDRKGIEATLRAAGITRYAHYRTLTRREWRVTSTVGNLDLGADHHEAVPGVRELRELPRGQRL